MPTLLEIINKNSELKSKAQANYKAIELFYSSSDCSVPMNIPNREQGFSLKDVGVQCQQNAYLLAKCYYDFLLLEDLDSSKLEDIITFLSNPFSPFSNPTEDSIPVLDTFFMQIADFLDEVNELKIMLDTYSHTQHSSNSINIDLSSVFDKQIDFLITSRGFDPILVQAASDQCFANQTSSASNEIVSEQGSINISNVFKFLNAFDGFIKRIPKKFTSEGLVPVFPDKDKIESLARCLQLLPTNFVQGFNTVFARIHYENALAASSFSSHNIHSFFSVDKATHNEKFNNVLTDILRPNR
jgi:hypothetical protein